MILVVSRVAVLRLVLLREPRIERRSFDHDVFRRCFFLLFWLFFFSYLFLFFFCCYLFFFVLFITRIEREREKRVEFLIVSPSRRCKRAYSYNTNKLFVFIFYDFFPRACRSLFLRACVNFQSAKIYTHTPLPPFAPSLSFSVFPPWRDSFYAKRPTHPNERTNERTNAKRGKRDLRERCADYKKEKERGTG